MAAGKRLQAMAEAGRQQVTIACAGISRCRAAGRAICLRSMHDAWLKWLLVWGSCLAEHTSCRCLFSTPQ